jgi:GntR family transcriptional regulator
VNVISFDQFKADSHSPIYQQIIRYIQRGIVAGSIRDGDELPSRRVLSALLGVNPNTVQKAFHLLEEAGLIASRLGSGSFMSLKEDQLVAIRQELLRQDTVVMINAMKQMGLSREQAHTLLEQYWDEDDINKPM